MTKLDQYNIKFYKKDNGFGELVNVFDANNAIKTYSNLNFIQTLYDADVSFLIETIIEMESNVSLDKNFLQSSEVYEMYEVEFDYPNFVIHDLTIHMSDLKLLLIEWLKFINPKYV